MNLIGLIIVLLILGIIFYSYVKWTLQREITDRGRAFYEPEFREERIRALSDALAANPPQDAKTASLWQQRGELYYYAGKFAEALTDARAYCALAPDDAAGWKELGEYALNCGLADEARTAARRANGLRERSENFILAIEACLYLNDTAAAERELAAWEKFEAAAAANRPVPHRWSEAAQMPQNGWVRYPWCAYYAAVIAECQGDRIARDAATEKIRQLDKEIDFGAVTVGDRLLYPLTPREIAGAVAVPFPEDEAAWANCAATLEKTFAATVTLPASALQGENSAGRKFEKKLYELMKTRYLPHRVYLQFADAAGREEFLRQPLAGDE